MSKNFVLSSSQLVRWPDWQSKGLEAWHIDKGSTKIRAWTKSPEFCAFFSADCHHSSPNMQSVFWVEFFKTTHNYLKYNRKIYLMAHMLKSQREEILHFTKKESPTARWESSFEHNKEYFPSFCLFSLISDVWVVEPNRNVKISDA